MGILVRDPTPSLQALPLEHLFRAAMRDLAGGVGIIAVGSGEGRTGMTATSVTSLSVDPPSLLVCVNRNSSTWAALKRYGAFAVNLLQECQAPIAERFSGRNGVKGAARYEGAVWSRLTTGAPILEDALASFDCEVEEMIERHSHAIVIGKVVAVRLAEAADALIYWRGAYDRLASSSLRVAPRPG